MRNLSRTPHQDEQSLPKRHHSLLPTPRNDTKALHIHITCPASCTVTSFTGRVCCLRCLDLPLAQCKGTRHSINVGEMASRKAKYRLQWRNWTQHLVPAEKHHEKDPLLKKEVAAPETSRENVQRTVYQRAFRQCWDARLQLVTYRRRPRVCAHSLLQLKHLLKIPSRQ